MKNIICFLFCTMILFSSVFADEIPIEKQKEIIDNYLYITGHKNHLNSASDDDSAQLPVKCGFPMVRQFQINKNKFDQNLLKSSGVNDVQVRPALTDSIVSPSGKFMIHFDRTGDNQPYSSVPGGIDGYIDSVALIMDHVYSYIIDTLGYPVPPADSFYASGGDEKYDVYIIDFNGAVYGLTYSDTVIADLEGDSVATTFMEFDNDYAELVQYDTRPLDAIRVTAAHEFFHAVQLGIDYYESGQVALDIEGPAWMEMSSVWMEEEVYDNINDYYSYLPIFFNQPWTSLQKFNPINDLHPYASVVFPLFLSEKYGRDIIKTIWLKCGEYGPGPHFLQVTGEVLDSINGSTQNFESDFNEFATWNYFTGSRAAVAPAGVGYEERANYPEFSDQLSGGQMTVVSSYPRTIGWNDNVLYRPEHNGSYYIKYRRLPYVVPRYFCLDSTQVDSVTYSCIDSVEVFRTLLQFDSLYGNNWGMTILGEDRYTKEVSILDSYLLPPFAISPFVRILVDYPQTYNSITYVLTPASPNRQLYVYPNDQKLTITAVNAMFLDSIPTNSEAVAFYPYPNPAVVNEMQNEFVKFHFELPTDTLGVPILNSGEQPYLTIDIFTVSGERLFSIQNGVWDNDAIDDNSFELTWDMKNESGKNVASGVYMALARFYDNDDKGNLLSEEKTKLLIVR
ncbi:MAG: hypothetical protein DWP97_08540 [Calditrichaeota bacterium]|nr:MAG: hypothetical protein DWP97_08540 [Calditrichota bacterium]